VDKRDEARLCERFEQFQFLGGLRGVEVEAPDAVPEPLVAALLHAVRVGDRPHAGRHTQHTHTHTHTHATQWRSRTFGRSGRWSNLPPFRLRLDAAKDPML